MTSILKAGWNLGKKVAITGAAISTAPVILPPLMVVSAMGFAFSVPFGLVLAGYVCNQKVMNYLLPAPDAPPNGFETFEEDYIGEEEEGEEEGMDMDEIDDRAELGDSTLADDAKEGDSVGWEQQSRVEETIDEDNKEGEKRKLPAGEEKNLYGDSFGSSGDDAASREPKQRTSETTYEEKMDDNSRQDNGPSRVGVRKEEVLVRENGEGIKANNEEIEGSDDSKKQEQVITEEERVTESEAGEVGRITPGGTCPAENITQEEEDKVEEEENRDRATGKEAFVLDIPIEEDDKMEEPDTTLGDEDHSSVSRTPDQDVASIEVAVVPDKASAKDQPMDEQTSVGDGKGLILGSSVAEENHTETKNEESIEVSHDEDLYSEEEIWNQINALRTIVGYKGDVHDSFMEELKALYVFTGVDPPSSPDGSSDLVQATENLQFLKTVIGVT